MATPKGKILRSNSLASVLQDVQKLISTAKEEIIEIVKAETNKINLRLDSLCNRVKAIEDDMTEIKAKQKDQENELCSLKLNIKTQGPQDPTEMYQEFELRLERSKNLIVRGFPEESSGSIEDRQQNDTGKFLCLMNELEIQDVAHKSLQRIGQIRSNGSRMLKITGLDSDKRREILQKSKALRNSRRFKHVYINPDMTPMEQQHHRYLQRELKDLRERGYAAYIYRGKIHTRNSEQNFH